MNRSAYLSPFDRLLFALQGVFHETSSFFTQLFLSPSQECQFWNDQNTNKLHHYQNIYQINNAILVNSISKTKYNYCLTGIIKYIDQEIFKIHLAHKILILYKIMRLLIALLILSLSQSFYIAVTPNLVCLHFKKDSQKTNFKFQVNAEQPQNVNINIINKFGQVTNSFAQEGGQAVFDGREQFKICFQTTDNTNKAVTIDVWSESESGLKGLAKKTEYYELHKALGKAADGLREISRLERFQEDRQNIHSELIAKSQSSIRTYGILKMVIMIGLAIGQIVFFKRLFSGRKILGI